MNLLYKYNKTKITWLIIINISRYFIYTKKDKENRLNVIVREDNLLLISEQYVLERWKQHFSALLNKHGLPSQPSTNALRSS